MKNACVAVVVGIAMIALSPMAEAQTLHGGIKGGLNLANIPTLADESDTEGVDSRYRKGIVVGGFATIRLTDWIAFQPEVLYTQKGVEFKESDFTNEFKLHTDYVDVPLLLRFQQASGRGVYALAGPSLNLNVSAKSTFEDDEEDFKDEVESFEAGVVLGAGFQLSNFLIEARFTEGLTNIVKNPDDSDDSYRNRSFAVMVGVRFP